MTWMEPWYWRLVGRVIATRITVHTTIPQVLA